MNDNDVTKNFYRNKPASLIAELLFLLTYHSPPLVFSVYHEFLLSVEGFLFLLALRGHLLHLLRQLSAKHKSKLTTMMQIKMKKRNLKRTPLNSWNNTALWWSKQLETFAFYVCYIGASTLFAIALTEGIDKPTSRVTDRHFLARLFLGTLSHKSEGENEVPWFTEWTNKRKVLR